MTNTIYDTILFDVDGTLCDPGPSLIESAQFALEQLGIHETDPAALHRFVGPPLEHAFKQYYAFDDATTKQAVAYFRQHLETKGLALYTVYDGIPELLEELKQAGKTLAVVTSKIDRLARMALETTGLIGYFEVIGAQQPDVVVQKEAILGEVLQSLGISQPSAVVMVGDRMHDIEAARSHRVDSIGVLYGYGSVEELTANGATYLAKDAAALKQLLNAPGVSRQS